MDIDGVDEKSEMLSAIGFKKTYSPTNPVEVPVGLTCPSNYQRPQLSQDPSILDEGEITVSMVTEKAGHWTIIRRFSWKL